LPKRDIDFMSSRLPKSLLHKAIAFTCLSLLGFAEFDLPTLAKVWTVEERQVQLMQDINNAEKSKQISSKEARALRKMQANIARKKAALRAKNRGKLTDDDIVKLNKDLDAASNKTHEATTRK